MTPLPAVGVVPLATVKGVQSEAHPPVQVLWLGLSFLNMYRVIPWLSTRIFPNFGLLATITVADFVLEEDELVEDDVDAGEVITQPTISADMRWLSVSADTFIPVGFGENAPLGEIL